MLHFFSTEAATELGVIPAILLQNIAFWCAKNENAGDERHFHDGRWWMFNSKTAFSKLYSYLTTNQIDHGLRRLRDREAVLVGHFNRVGYDRTNWYTPTEYGWSLVDLAPIDDQKTVDDVLSTLPEELRESAGGFVAMRQELGKPVSGRGLDYAVKKAMQFSSNDADLAAETIDQSTLNNWQDVYQLDDV